jgi:hypothetical protein
MGAIAARSAAMDGKWLFVSLGVCIALACRVGQAEEIATPAVPSRPTLPAMDPPAYAAPAVDLSAASADCPPAPQTTGRPRNRFIPTMFGDLLGFTGQFGGGQFGQFGTGGFNFGQFGGGLNIGQFGVGAGGGGLNFGQFGTGGGVNIGQFGTGGGGFNLGNFGAGGGGLNIGQFGQFGAGGGGLNFGQFGTGGFNFGQFGGGQFGQFGQFGFNGAPIAVARGAFKVAENESPLPQDRVFLNYNYYNNVEKFADVHRETAGFEKTFLNGDVSIGLRLPYFQVDGPNGTGDQEIDDLNVVVKAALLRDPVTLSALTTGLVVTAPTGPAGFTKTGEKIHPTLIQPFVGYMWDTGDLYLIGFTSLMAPTDRRDVTVLFNDVGVGYWLYRAAGDGFLAGIVPTFEVHVNTPLSQRSDQDPNKYADSVNLTTGCHFVLPRGSSLGVAIGTPVTGPKLFDFEGIVQFNWRF